MDLDLITLDVCSFSRCPKNVSVAVSNWPFLGPRDHRSDQSTHLILSSLKLQLLTTPPPVSHARYIHGLPAHFTHKYRTHSSVHSHLMLAPAHASPSTSDGLFLAGRVGTQAVPSPIYLPAFLDHSQDQLPQVRFPGSKH